MARRLAKAIGYRYIDSGAMYRAVTLYAMQHGFIAADGSIDKAALVSALPEIKIDFKVTPTDSGLNSTTKMWKTRSAHSKSRPTSPR